MALCYLDFGLVNAAVVAVCALLLGSVGDDSKQQDVFSNLGEANLFRMALAVGSGMSIACGNLLLSMAAGVVGVAISMPLIAGARARVRRVAQVGGPLTHCARAQGLPWRWARP